MLRLSIDEAEADRRHQERTRDTKGSVAKRNVLDAHTAQKLGSSAVGVTEVDVTYMSALEQAELLRQFINENAG